MHKVNPTFFEKIKSIILDSRTKIYRAANTELLFSYWEIGRVIVEEEQSGELRAQYGKETLKRLSQFLTFELGKGFDESNLRNMRSFFIAFPIRDTLRHELSWSHYRLLTRIEGSEKKQFYLNEAVHSNWNTRELQRQINTLAFERRLDNPMSHDSNAQSRLIKDPYIFEFLGLSNDLKNTEYSIESAIINHVQKFLMELGRGFAFVARQQHIVTDTSDFYIDLVFYNYLLKCFVIVDLKTTQLTHQDIGQIDMYVRMYDDLKRGAEDNPTIGILLCTEKDETIVKYSVLNDNKNLYASKYLLYLPKEEELKALIERDRDFFESNNNEA
ncbi:hypothetical protein D3C71_726070 [compost metagenome]